jgi:seryl-tRNA synthetase
MNDATAFSQRPLIALMENNQQEDGSILIPKVLQQWTGKEKIESRG